VGECQCPGAPHDGLDGRDDGDWIELRPALSLDAGLEAMTAYRIAVSDPEFNVDAVAADGEMDAATIAARQRSQGILTRGLFPIFARDGLIGWNFCDESGPVACTADNAATLDFPTKFVIADLADDIYGVTVVTPLVQQMERLSPSGQTVSSTSPNRQSRRHPPRQSARSLRAISAATEQSA
jgi:hypothetical protein